jgi:hypothetical protein
METQSPVMVSPLHQAEVIFNLNSRLFPNALNGISEEQAKERLSDHNNPVSWIAAHTVWARYNACAMLGKPALKNPYGDKFENFKPFDPSVNYGTLAESKEEWLKATGLLQKALAEVTEDHLVSESPIKFPVGDSTIGGAIAFFAQHESYQVGQLAFLKKYLTKEAMSYKE